MDLLTNDHHHTNTILVHITDDRCYFCERPILVMTAIHLRVIIRFQAFFPS